MSADLFIEKAAVISPCGRYRYLLRRVWDHDRPRALFVMLNPSTADAEIDDQTIRSCTRLGKACGHGSFEVANLYGWRATNPDELSTVDDPIGPDNDRIADAAINRCDLVICAWGAHPISGRRNRRMWELTNYRVPAAFCFGKTKAGYPKHPLYIKTGTPLVAYPCAAKGPTDD